MSDTPATPLTEVLERALERTGLSRRRLAEQLGTSASILHRLSKGDTTKVDLPLGLKLLEAAGLSPAEYMGKEPVGSCFEDAVIERLDSLNAAVAELTTAVFESIGTLAQLEQRNALAREFFNLATHSLNITQASKSMKLPVDDLAAELDQAIEFLRSRRDLLVAELPTAGSEEEEQRRVS